MPEETLTPELQDSPTEVSASNEENTATTGTAGTPVTAGTPATAGTTTTTESTSNSCCGKNTLGLVALVIAVIGLLLTISIAGSFFGIPLLVLAFILGLIALFKRPRGKARASVIVSGLPLGCFCYLFAVFGSLFIQPIVDFSVWIQDEMRANPVMEAVFEQP